LDEGVAQQKKMRLPDSSCAKHVEKDGPPDSDRLDNGLLICTQLMEFNSGRRNRTWRTPTACCPIGGKSHGTEGGGG